MFHALKETKCYALTRRYIDEMFKRYPEIGAKIKSESFKRYKIMIKDPIMKQKQIDMEGEDSVSQSDKSSSKNGAQKSQKQPQEFPQADEPRKDQIVGNNDDLNTVLKKKIDGIQEEMGKFAKNINEYVKSCDNEISNIVHGLQNK